MSELNTLSAFFKENEIKKEPVKYVASKRYVVDGKPIEWELRALTNDEMETLRRKCTKKEPIKGTRDYKTTFDGEKFNLEATMMSVIYPNLNDVELQTNRGTIGAEETLKDMLTPGELADLFNAVSEANDFESGMKDKIKTVKNSGRAKTVKRS